MKRTNLLLGGAVTLVGLTALTTKALCTNTELRKKAGVLKDNAVDVGMELFKTFKETIDDIKSDLEDIKTSYDFYAEEDDDFIDDTDYDDIDFDEFFEEDDEEDEEMEEFEADSFKDELADILPTEENLKNKDESDDNDTVEEVEEV